MDPAATCSKLSSTRPHDLCDAVSLAWKTIRTNEACDTMKKPIGAMNLQCKNVFLLHRAELRFDMSVTLSYQRASLLQTDTIWFICWRVAVDLTVGMRVKTSNNSRQRTYFEHSCRVFDLSVSRTLGTANAEMCNVNVNVCDTYHSHQIEPRAKWVSGRVSYYHELKMCLITCRWFTHAGARVINDCATRVALAASLDKLNTRVSLVSINNHLRSPWLVTL